MSKTPPTPLSFWKRLRRRLLAQVTVALLTLCLIFLFIGMTPFSSDLLDEQIRQEFRNDTGLQIAFDKCVYHLSKRSIQLYGVSISNPQGSENILQMERMSVLWSLRWLKPSAPVDLRSIQIITPRPFTCYLSPDFRFTPGPALGGILDFFSEVDAAASTPATRTPETFQIQIKGFSILLCQPPRSPSPSQQTSEKIISGLESVEITAQISGNSIWPLQVSGFLHGTPTSAVAATLERDAQTGRFHIASRLEFLDPKTHFQAPLPFRGRIEDVLFQAEWGAEDKNTTRSIATISLQSPQMQLSVPRLSLDLSPSPLKVRASFVVDREDGCLQFSNSQMEGWDSRIDWSADFFWTNQQPTEVRVQKARLAPLLLNTLASTFDHTRRVLVQKGETLLRGRLTTADWQEGPWQLPQATLEIFAGQYTLTDLPKAIRTFSELDASLKITTHSLNVRHLSAHVGTSRFAIKEGYVARRHTPTMPQPFQAEWETDLDLPLLRSLPLGRLALWLKKRGMQGQIEGEGSIQGIIPAEIETNKISRLLDTLGFQGKVQLKNVALTLPVVPARLTNLRGGMELTTETIQTQELQGQVLGSTVGLSGEIRGKPFFWNAPSAKLHTKGHIDLAAAPKAPLIKHLSHREQRKIESLDLKGQIGLDLSLQGPLTEPRNLQLSGQVQTSSISLQSTFGTHTQTIRSQNATWTVDLPRRIALEEMHLQINNLHNHLSGALTNQGARASLETFGPLPEYGALLPPLARNFHLGGEIGLKLEGHALRRPDGEGKPPDPDMYSLVQWAEKTLPSLMEQKNPARIMQDLDAVLDWDFQANLEARDAEFTHVFMPSRVHHIRGNFLINKQGLKALEPIDSIWGTSPGQVKGEVAINRLGTLEVRFDGFFPNMILDDWAKPWGPKNRDMSEWDGVTLPDFDQAAPLTKTPLLDIEGRIRADKGSYRRFQMQDVQANFSYTDLTERKGILDFESLRAGLYGGTMELQAWTFVFGPLIRWEVGVNLDDVPCEEIIEDHYQTTSTLSGLLSGDITLRGESGTPLSGGGAFELKQSRFLDNAIFSALGSLLRSQALKDIAFTEMVGRFQVEGNLLVLSDVRLAGPIMALTASGTSDLDGWLDLLVTYRFLSIASRIPLLSTLTGVVEDVTGWFLRAHIGGTVEKPEISLVPLSADKLKLMNLAPREEPEDD